MRHGPMAEKTVPLVYRGVRSSLDVDHRTHKQHVRDAHGVVDDATAVPQLDPWRPGGGESRLSVVAKFLN
jgi:hypothetical protein